MGLTNGQLERHFGANKLLAIAQVLNILLDSKRVHLYNSTENPNELMYKLVAEEQAQKFEGIGPDQMLVYQICERSGSKGVLIGDIKAETKITEPTFTKTLKLLESRQIIKAVRSVTSNSRKFYMLFATVPDKEITGGPWYTDQEFDHAFVDVLQKCTVNFVKTAAKKHGEPFLSASDILNKLVSSDIIAVNTISLDELILVMHTLVYDGKLEEVRNASLGDHVAGSGTIIKYKVAKDYDPPNFLTETPCGICPAIAQCREGGIISPTTCVYMNDWLALNYDPNDMNGLTW